MEQKHRHVISKWQKKRGGIYFEQVVYKTPNGKKSNGKPALKSVTKHEPVK